MCLSSGIGGGCRGFGFGCKDSKVQHLAGALVASRLCGDCLGWGQPASRRRRLLRNGATGETRDEHCPDIQVWLPNSTPQPPKPLSTPKPLNPKPLNPKALRT